MSRRSRRKQASLVPRSTGIPFSDASDDRAEDSLYRGAGESFIDSSEQLPRAQERVHRYISVPISVRGYGGRAPIQSLQARTARLWPLELAVAPRGRSIHKGALRFSSDRAAFNVLQVSAPSRVKFCLQRKARKEVLFAKRVAGKRGGSPGPYKRNAWSQWRC